MYNEHCSLRSDKVPKIIENLSDIILEHAREILLNEGYEKLSIRNVAKSCGLGIGTIYNYFPNKRDLIRQMILGYWEEYLEFLDKVEEGQESLFEKIKHSYEKLDSQVSKFKEIWVKICMDFSPESVHADMEVKKDFIEKLVRKFENIIKDELGRHPEEFDTPLDSYGMSKFIVQNLMMMSINKNFEYDSFEIILKKLFQQR